jgi:hypothetical protein
VNHVGLDDETSGDPSPPDLLRKKAIADWLGIPVLAVDDVPLTVTTEVALILNEQAEMARERAETRD